MPFGTVREGDRLGEQRMAQLREALRDLAAMLER